MDATFKSGATLSSGKWVWQTNDSRDANHRFTYRFTYAFSGTGSIPANAVEFKIPKQILKNRDGNYADYYDIAVPSYDDPELAGSDTKYVYKEFDNYILIYNIKEISAAENG